MKAARWLPAAGMSLEPNALLACKETTRCVAVTAGPGAGKTELLAQRADFLLRTQECPFPKRILAISFKTDAAANLGARVRSRLPTEFASRLDSHTFHAFALSIVRRFRIVLTGHNQLEPDFTVGDQRVFKRQITFKDMVPFALEILAGCPAVSYGLRSTYSDVFLDEFQDCTREQYELVRSAFFGYSTRLTAVGDTKQRIMGFAGALEGVFRTFADDFGALPLNLYQNFRSMPRLRRMQNRIVAVMDHAAAVPAEDLAGDAGTIEVFGNQNEYQEADRVTAWIRQRLTEGTPEGEIAVLIAKTPELYGRALFTSLNSSGIPFRYDQELQDLAAQPLARLLVAYFELLATRRSPSAYALITSSRLFRVEDEDRLFRRRIAWHDHIDSTIASITERKTDLADASTLAFLARGFLDFFGGSVIAALHPDYDSAAWTNRIVQQVAASAASLLANSTDPATALTQFGSPRAVRVMSIHKCKGLEFEAVAVLAVEEEMFWSNRDEERAAFFVAISRTKRALLLTHAAQRNRPHDARRWDVERTPDREFLSYAYDPP